MTLQDCHPTFIKNLTALAERNGLTVAEAYAKWRAYSDASHDQSALLSEFEDGLKRQARPALMNDLSKPVTPMHAGTVTGSLINHVMSGNGTLVPEAGMGCTILGWTDRHAATIVEIKRDGKLIGIRQDDAKRVDQNGMSEDQTYEYSPNPAAPIQWFSWRPQAQRFCEVGARTGEGRGLRIGSRNEYHDFSF